MKTLIWTSPVRIFHTLLIIALLGVFVTGDGDSFKNYHYAFGAAAGALLALRIIFGFFGSKYANFRDFTFNVNKTIEYAKTYFAKTKIYAGHNPLASYVMLFIFILGLLAAVSGYLLYGVEGNTVNLAINHDALKDVHEGIAHILLALVIVHFIGFIADAIFNKATGTLTSIFNGHKNIEAESSNLSTFQKIYSAFWIVIPVIVFFWAFSLPIVDGEKDEKNKIENSEHHDNDKD